MPPLPLIEQLWIHVLATLATITTGNGYWTTLATITRGMLSPLESFGMPFASLLPIDDIPEYVVGVINRDPTFVIRVWIDDAPATAGTTLELLVADVKKAMAVDITRGGIVQHTLEEGVQYLYVVSTERLAGADIRWRCPYRTTFTDPAQEG